MADMLLDPRTFGLLNIGLSMMRNSGPSRTPQTLGSILGGAGQEGLQSMVAMEDQQRKAAQAEAMINLEKQKAALTQTQMEREAQKQAMLNGILSRLSGANPSVPAQPPMQVGMSDQSAASMGAPWAAASTLPQPAPQQPQGNSFPFSVQDLAALKLGTGVDMLPYYQESKPKLKVGEGGRIIDENNPGPVGSYVPGISTRDVGGSIQRIQRNADGSETVLEAIPKTAAPGSLPAFITRTPTGESKVDPVVLGAMGQLASAGKTSVTVNNKEQTEFSKKLGAQNAEAYTGLMKAEMNAPVTVSKYQRLGELLKQVNTGKFAGNTVDLKSAAKGIGIDIAALGIRDDVAPAQAARAMINQLALELRTNADGSSSMPGAMSDSDRQFLMQMVPSLENDPQAIGKMIDYRIRIANREKQIAKMAREYRRKTGSFDDGFNEELSRYSDANPLFPEASSAVPNVQLSPRAQKYLDQYRGK